MLDNHGPNTVIAEVSGPTAKSFTLEVDCVELLCQQDSLLSKIVIRGKPCSQKTLDLAKQMLVHYLDFCEIRLEEPAMTELSARIGSLYDGIRAMEELLHNSAWRSVRRLVGGKVPDESEVSATYQELGKEFAEFHADFFTYCVDHALAPASVKAQFLESVKSFLTEVAAKW
jgi:hypothetical protein